MQIFLLIECLKIKHGFQGKAKIELGMLSAVPTKLFGFG